MNIRGFNSIIKKGGDMLLDKWYKDLCLNWDFIEDKKIKAKIKKLREETTTFLFYAMYHPNMIYNEWGIDYRTDTLFEVIIRIEKMITLLELLKTQKYSNIDYAIETLTNILNDVYRISVRDGGKERK